MSALFEHEEVRYGNGFPSLIRFFKGDTKKPLVVFFPGWAHLGRISYGFPGCQEKHFLAHWLMKKGYTFLATSYPIDHPVYPDAYPNFTLSDWGEMTAEIVDQIISENNLCRDVIGVNWSAAGQVIRPFNIACNSRGINVRFALALEASPAIQLPSDLAVKIRKTDKGMLSLKDSRYDLFWKELKEQNRINREQILNEEQFKDYFLGDIPVAISGGNEFFEDSRFVEDVSRGFEDKGFFSFSEYPLVAVISGRSTIFPYHSIVDKSTWSFLNTRKIYHEYISKSQGLGFEISHHKLKEFVSYLNKIPEIFGAVIPQTHFLFVGEKGAKSVADQLEIFDQKVDKIKADISGILS